MAHFAQLDENNLVIQVIVVHNNELIAPDGTESEYKGIEFCKSLFGADTVWVQTSYNAKLRKNYAGIGFTYRTDLDAFVPPQPDSDWTFNEATASWDPPISYWEERQMHGKDMPPEIAP
jgi:hypothetical protein